MREKQDYRENLAKLTELFPDKVAIDLCEAAKVLSCSRLTLYRSETFPKKKILGKWAVPIVGLAKWLS